MCYSGECFCEDYSGDCNLSSEDREFLKEKYGFEYLCFEPEGDLNLEEWQDWQGKIYREILDQREAREIMRKLSK